MIRSLFRTRNREPQSECPRVSRQREMDQRLPDASPFERELVLETASTTMTSPERLLAFSRAIQYVEDSGLAGDIVECGVWRGGSMYAAGRTLLSCGSTTRDLWLYDTFEGMSSPGDPDVDFLGRSAQDLLEHDRPEDPQGVWCVSPLDEVKQHLSNSGYPMERIHFVVGPVEETLPQTRPGSIAVLRLDTDWYESTRCELEYLYPLLVPGGVLIVDDYGHWQGCRRAVDEYFESGVQRVFLNRIDYTGRIAVKPS